ncbi:MAG: hypothetical protein V2I54_11235 [Bacteroidales bacterium]|jgi:hypothetical protein|nr:hypothetical protein [Bacteroidales bacterium]
MKRKLTPQDRKKLKASARVGFIISFLMFLVSLAPWIISILENKEGFLIYLTPIGILMSVIILWLANRKFWSDLRAGEKDVLIKTIDKKVAQEDYEAGSSAGFSTNGKKSAFYKEMNAFTNYAIIVENVKYRVDKELWDRVEEKDKVEFHFAPKSRELLAIKED